MELPLHKQTQVESFHQGSEKSPELKKVQGAENVIGLVSADIANQHPDWTAEEVALQVDHDIAGLIDTANAKNESPYGYDMSMYHQSPAYTDVIEADVTGLVEEMKSPGGEVAGALGRSEETALTEAFEIVQSAGGDKEALALVAKEIDVSHGDRSDYINEVNRQVGQVRQEHSLTGDVVFVDGVEGRSERVAINMGKLSQEELRQLLEANDPDVGKYALEFASRKIDFHDQASFQEHMKIFHALRNINGNPYTWGKKGQRGSIHQETMARYGETDQLSVLTMQAAFEDAAARIEAVKNNKNLNAEQINAEIVVAKQSLRMDIGAALSHGLRLSREMSAYWDNDRKGMAMQYLHGDIAAFGFSAGPNGQAVPNEKMRLSAMNYIANVTEIGPDACDRLHHELGIVNFDRYNKEQLKLASEITQPGANAKELLPPDGSISILISGVNGDHGGAYPDAMRAVRTTRMVPFEISSAKDLAKVDSLRYRVGAPIGQLTLAGHGGEGGLRMSRNLLIGHFDGNNNGVETITPGRNHYLHNLLYAIETDNETNRAPITLMSCSQGKNFKHNVTGKKQMSLAERFADTGYLFRVTAARETAYALPSQKAGNIYMAQQNFASRILKQVETGTRTLPAPLVNFLRRHIEKHGWSESTASQVDSPTPIKGFKPKVRKSSGNVKIG